MNADAFRDVNDAERRYDTHGGITTFLLPNGTRLACTCGRLSAVFARSVLAEHSQFRMVAA